MTRSLPAYDGPEGDQGLGEGGPIMQSISNKLPPHDVLAEEVITLLKEAVSEFEAAVAVVKKARKKG